MSSEIEDQILDNLTTAVLALDRGLRPIAINPAAEALLQLSAKKVLGQPLPECLPNNRPLMQALEQVLSDGNALTTRGIQLVLANDQGVTVDCTVSRLADDDDNSPLLVELSHVDRLLRLAKDEKMFRRQNANRAVLNGLAHEIKNPLGGLRGAAQLLERELHDESLKEYTNIIIHEADRLRNLVDRMVEPNRPIERRPTNLHAILEHVRNLVLAEIPEGITIERDYDPSLPNLIGDSAQLIQAILNITRNAAEALDGRGVIQLRTGIERQFTIGQKCHRLVLRADVEDNGPGIPDDLIDSIFYPMVTARPEGTGLGLSIAQDIINKHGGLIECTSQPKQTIFSIYLPLESKDG